MMSVENILELIEKGETGRVEFKSEMEKNIDFAKEITAFANGSGGYLLIGVDDNRQISGITNSAQFEEKIYNICSDSTRPVVSPELWKYEIEGKTVFCFYVSAGFSKPYAILRKGRERYYIRRGTSTREASRDELIRLFQTSGQIHYETTPVIKGKYSDLDFEKIAGFFNFNRINPIDISDWPSEKTENFLINKELLVHSRGKLHPTVAGALLFSRMPSSMLGYNGMTVTKFADVEKDYNYMDFRLDLPLMNSFMGNGAKSQSGLLDEALERIKLLLSDKSTANLREAERVIELPYPEESIREAVVNAVAHRDYTITGLDIRVDIYPDRLEIESPGRLPNTVSIESIKVGAKYYRNQVIVQYLKEAGFMDLHSLGIPVKILKLCGEYSGREPLLEEREHGFKVTLYPRLEPVLNEVEKQILDALKGSDNPLKSIEIGERLGLTKRTALNWINRLIDKKMVEPTSANRRDPKRKYRIKN